MSLRRFFILLAPVVVVGCSRPIPTSTTQPEPVAEVIEQTFEPAHVELADATATVNENVIQFQVNYKFTSGKPVKFYLVEFAFPGTEHRRQKAMEAWEMKPEGTVKSGVELPEGADPQEFSVTLSEADSPDRGYTVISNTLNGKIAAKQ